MNEFIIGFLIGGAILTIEQAEIQWNVVAAGNPISEEEWISSEAFNRAQEFLSECEDRTGCFAS